MLFTGQRNFTVKEVEVFEPTSEIADECPSLVKHGISTVASTEIAEESPSATEDSRWTVVSAEIVEESPP
jgi:hypothetical protein